MSCNFENFVVHIFCISLYALPVLNTVLAARIVLVFLLVCIKRAYFIHIQIMSRPYRLNQRAQFCVSSTNELEKCFQIHNVNNLTRNETVATSLTVIKIGEGITELIKLKLKSLIY